MNNTCCITTPTGCVPVRTEEGKEPRENMRDIVAGIIGSERMICEQIAQISQFLTCKSITPPDFDNSSCLMEDLFRAREALGLISDELDTLISILYK